MPFSTVLPAAAADTTTYLRKRGKTPTAHNLLKLAKAARAFDTKTAARQALQRAGFVATPPVVEDLIHAAETIARARTNRVRNAFLKRLGHAPDNGYRSVTGRPAVLLPLGTPTARLDATRKTAVARAARSTMRYGASGGHSIEVEFALDPSKVNYLVTIGQNWNTYRGDFKGWSAKEDHHVITVPRDWRLRVARKGLATLGAMMTLDAHPLISDGDVQLYAATWARQGRGFEVKVDRGYIAMLGREHFHADTAQAASKGVQRKVKAAGAPARQVVSAYALTVDAFVKRYAGRNLNVSVSDAEESGACDFGIRSWCEFVGLDYDKGDAHLEQVLQGFQARPQEEVRRAILYAVRRHRAEQQRLKSTAPHTVN